MKNNIDQLLFSAFADATPDHIDSIVKQTENKNAGAIMSVTQENYRKKTLHYAAFAAAISRPTISRTSSPNGFCPYSFS